jgi:hypothetical protein
MNMFRKTACLLVVMQAWLGVMISGMAGEPIDFNRDIRPMLSDKCFFCHGPDEAERKAELRLDTPTGAFLDLGGYAALKKGSLEESELWARIITEDEEDLMPPLDSGKSLSSGEKEQIKQWILEGASYQGHWSYTAPIRPSLPELKDHTWPAQAVDHFILSKLEAEEIRPSPQAAPSTLARRLHLDLTGLPPSAEDTRRFSEALAKGKWRDYVRGLIHTPAYGERMASHWLDLVRFADTVGYHGDQDHSISPYRDYVIKSFNENMPYDQFTREQLAGDLLPRRSMWQQVASGYNRLLQTSHEGGVQDREYLAKYAADRVRNFGLVWMGATTGCAECHHHKYDPYTTEDFYSLAAFFADLKEQGAFSAPNAIPTRRNPEIKVWNLAQYAQLTSLNQSIDSLKKETEGNESAAQAALEALEEKRSSIEDAFAPCMVSLAVKPRTMRVLPRGNWLDETGTIVQPATPVFLPPMTTAGKATRLDLANWLFQEDHPLTARVFVNRLWKLFFGKGLSRRLDDLGAQGDPPDHPALLDWLAVEFRESGWNVKHMVELMVTSSTYLQGSAPRPDLKNSDPENRLWAQQNAFRIDAEFIRDRALKLGGLLVEQLGGRSVKPYQPKGYYQHLNFPTRNYQADTGSLQYRRGLYTHWQRIFLHPMLKAFDAPSREEGSAERPVSNTPLAALTLLNDPSFNEAARHFAHRILNEGGSSDAARLQWAWRETLSRQAVPKEIKVMEAFLGAERGYFLDKTSEAGALIEESPVTTPGKDGTTSRAEQAAWTSVARAMLNLHEGIMRY